MWALDTDTLTLWLRGHAKVVRQVAAHDPEDLSLTIISVEEILSGWYRLIRQARSDDKLVRAYQSLQQSVEFLKQVQILPLTAASVQHFHRLRKAHRTIGTNDLRIALDIGAVVVSRNLADFRPISGLAVEDWSA